MNIMIIICFILLIICIVINVLVFIKINNQKEENKTDTQLMAQLILLDKKINFIQDEIETMSYLIKNMEPVKIKEVDEMAGFLKSGMTVSDIAKKKNISVKEVELILKMKGLA